MENGNNYDKNQLTDEILQKLTASKKINKTPKSKSIRLKTFHFFHRLWQIIFSIPFLIPAVVIHFLLIIRKIFANIHVFKEFQFYGKKGEIQTIRFFNTSHASTLSLFYHIVSGKLSLTGYSLNLERCVGDAFIYDYPPGMITLWYIRSSSRTAYEGRKETDMEFVRNELLKAELKPSLISFLKLVKAEFMLIIRFIVAKIFHSAQSDTIQLMIDPFYLFSIRLRNLSMQNALDSISNTIDLCRNADNCQTHRKRIYFINPDCLNKFFEKNNEDYHDFLYNINERDMIFADGIGINIAADMMGYPKNENVNGTDMFPRLCKLAADNNYKIFLLGARPGIPELVKENMETQYPSLNIAGTRHGYFDHETESDQIIDNINKIDPDIVLVAFGVPAQERWINSIYHKLNCPVIMGVGGLFDFYSGRIKRAPRWMRDIGLEWVFRLLMEPKRMFKRYVIGNPLFLNRVKNLDKSAKFIIKKIIYLKKKQKSETINIFNSKKFKNRFCESIDLMPQIFAFCQNNNINISLDSTKKPSLTPTINTIKEIFPNLNIDDNPLSSTNAFKLIFTDNPLTSTDPSKLNKDKPLTSSDTFKLNKDNPAPDKNFSNNALIIIDQRFIKELKKIQIIKN